MIGMYERQKKVATLDQTNSILNIAVEDTSTYFVF